MSNDAHKNDGLFSAIERHATLSLGSPFIVAAVFVLLRYVGGDVLRRVLDFITFSPAK